MPRLALFFGVLFPFESAPRTWGKDMCENNYPYTDPYPSEFTRSYLSLLHGTLHEAYIHYWKPYASRPRSVPRILSRRHPLPGGVSRPFLGMLHSPDVRPRVEPLLLSLARPSRLASLVTILRRAHLALLLDRQLRQCWLEMPT